MRVLALNEKLLSYYSKVPKKFNGELTDMEGKKPKESVDLANFLSIKVISDDDTKRIKKLRQHLDKAFKIKYLVVKKKKGE